MAINWYSHHIGDYEKKTKHLTILEHGCYRLLLDHFYSNGGPFPDDKKRLHKILGAINGAERRAIAYCLSHFFVLGNDGLWNQNRASEEISKYNEIKEIRKNIGSIGGAKAQANRVAKQYPPTPTPTPIEESNPIGFVPATEIAKGNTHGKPKGKSEHIRIPEDWKPHAKHFGKCTARGLDITILIEEFRNYHTARATKFASWDAAFFTWIGNAEKFDKDRKQSLANKSQPHSIVAAGLRVAARFERAREQGLGIDRPGRDDERKPF